MPSRSIAQVPCDCNCADALMAIKRTKELKMLKFTSERFIEVPPEEAPRGLSRGSRLDRRSGAILVIRSLSLILPTAKPQLSSKHSEALIKNVGKTNSNPGRGH